MAPTGKRRSSHWVGWVIGIVCGLAVVAGIGYAIMQYLNDPYRTLEPFPVDRYLSDYRSLSGSKFKAEAKVANDLGYDPAKGRLMTFQFGTDTHPVPVLIPPKFANIYFTKGQNYKISLEVGDGGLIYADSCEKD